MDQEHPHHLRLIIMSVVALITVLASLSGAVLYVRSATPQTLSLAYRIDPKQTLLFFRTTDRQEFLSNIASWNTHAISAPLPKPDAIPQGLSYEYALLRSGSGALHGVMSIRRSNRHQEVFPSDQKASKLLPFGGIGQSLGRSAFFRSHTKPSDTHLILVNPDVLPLLKEHSSPILPAILAPFRLLLGIWNSEAVTLTLEKKIASDDSAAIIESIGMRLWDTVPAQTEGFQGILQSGLRKATGRTGLLSAMHDLLMNGINLTVTKDDSGTAFVLAGNATNVTVLQSWIDGIKALLSSARIRLLTLPDGNSRSDVVAAPLVEETLNGWTVASGSGVDRLAIAQRGNRFVVSNDPLRLRLSLETDTAARNPLSVTATIDTRWLHDTLTPIFPSLQQDLIVLKDLFPLSNDQLSIEAHDAGETISVRLSH